MGYRMGGYFLNSFQNFIYISISIFHYTTMSEAVESQVENCDRHWSPRFRVVKLFHLSIFCSILSQSYGYRAIAAGSSEDSIMKDKGEWERDFHMHFFRVLHLHHSPNSLSFSNFSCQNLTEQPSSMRSGLSHILQQFCNLQLLSHCSM